MLAGTVSLWHPGPWEMNRKVGVDFPDWCSREVCCTRYSRLAANKVVSSLLITGMRSKRRPQQTESTYFGDWTTWISCAAFLQRSLITVALEVGASIT